MTEAENEYVIRGNAAIVHCKIPSFISDFVYIETWLLNDGEILTVNNTNTVKGKFIVIVVNHRKFLSNNPNFMIKSKHYLICIVVPQPFEAEADNEYVIRGNAAIMKCEVPSFVSDFVYVEMWMDSEGGTYHAGSDEGNA